MLALAVICTSSGRQSWKDMLALDVRVISSFRTEFTFISQWDLGLVLLTWRESIPSVLTSTEHDTKKSETLGITSHCSGVISPNSWRKRYVGKRPLLSLVTSDEAITDLPDIDSLSPYSSSLLCPKFSPSHPDCSTFTLVITQWDKSERTFSNLTPATACSWDHSFPGNPHCKQWHLSELCPKTQNLGQEKS